MSKINNARAHHSTSKLRSKVLLRLKNIDRNGFWRSEAGEHSKRVARKMSLFADDLGVDVIDLFSAGLFHDVGKCALDQDILYKNGALTDEEYSHIRTHGVRGFFLLKGESRFVREAALHHHDVDEHGDLYIQILHLVDIEDALSNRRCYKAPMSPEQVQKILEKESTRMSPEAQNIFWSRYPQIIELN